jgi:alpha-D-xyloside xylohydrolase
MPYLYRAAIQSHEQGTPMLRAMILELPNDPACDYLDQQYMLGESLLIAPVFRPDGVVDYYVPEGKWTHLLTGEVIGGPRWVKETHDPLSLPLLVRPNSAIPMGRQADRPDYDYADGVTLQVYQLEEGNQATVDIPSVDGRIETRFEIRCDGNEIQIQRQGSSKPWSVLLVGIGSVENVNNASHETVNGSLLIKVNEEVDEIKIPLR